VSYAVDLMRGALGQPMEFSIARSLAALGIAPLAAFVFAVVVFDPGEESGEEGSRR
jgi:hypothetical protein